MKLCQESLKASQPLILIQPKVRYLLLRQQVDTEETTTVDKRQKEADAVRADIQDLARTGTEQRLMNVDYEAGTSDKGPCATNVVPK